MRISSVVGTAPGGTASQGDGDGRRVRATRIDSGQRTGSWAARAEARGVRRLRDLDQADRRAGGARARVRAARACPRRRCGRPVSAQPTRCARWKSPTETASASPSARDVVSATVHGPMPRTVSSRRRVLERSRSSTSRCATSAARRTVSARCPSTPASPPLPHRDRAPRSPAAAAPACRRAPGPARAGRGARRGGATTPSRRGPRRAAPARPGTSCSNRLPGAGQAQPGQPAVRVADQRGAASGRTRRRRRARPAGRGRRRARGRHPSPHASTCTPSRPLRDPGGRGAVRRERRAPDGAVGRRAATRGRTRRGAAGASVRRTSTGCVGR